MLKFLGDETGTDKQPRTRVSAIAGLVGTEKAWNRFDREWRAALKAEGVPYFHAVECEKGVGEFYGMDAIKRGKVAGRLVGVILNSSLQPHSYGVVIPQFNEMSEAFRKHYTLDHPDIPYYLCLHHTFVEVSHFADDLPKDEQVYFRFEKQDEFEKDAQESFDIFKTNPHWPNSSRLGKCCFVPEEQEHEYPGLQAADLLAYETYRHLDNRHFQPNLRPELKVRTAFALLQKKLQQHAKFFERDIMTVMEADRITGQYEFGK